MKKHILTLLIPTLMASNAMAAQLYQAEDGSVLNIYLVLVSMSPVKMMSTAMQMASLMAVLV